MADSADPLARLAGLEGVGSGMAAARDGIDALLRDRGLRRTTPGLTTEALLRGAHASAVLEGSTATLQEVRAGQGDDLSASAVRLSAELLGLVPVLDRSPLQAFARLHTVAGAGVVEEAELGRPRPGAAERLGALGRLLTARTAAPALLAAAVAHAELQAVQPFGSHTGLVARAVERMILVGRGVDPACVLVPEAGHLSLRAEYASNLGAYVAGGSAGLRAWLLYAAEAYTQAAEASPLRDPG